MKKQGTLVVVSGFAGTGKGTVMKELLGRYDSYALSISATTRNPRPGEVDGREYFFKTKEEFEQMIANNEFVEHACYVGNYYGQFNERKLVGCKIQETVAYGVNQDMSIGRGLRGMGINRSTIYEGIRKNNFFGTYLIGPFLIMNPYFTHFLFSRMGIARPVLAHANALKDAYARRIEEFENRSTVMEYF